MSKYSREFKLIIAKQCLDGMSSIQLAQKYSIPSRQIRCWTQVFAVHGSGSTLTGQALQFGNVVLVK